ncbi:hypothetical protein U1Q18_050623 [Sarracenia purpurea var. burkii]
MLRTYVVICIWAAICASTAYARPHPYDPDDTNLPKLLPSEDKEFEAFYPREAYGVKNGSARPSHGHGSYYKFRNPALVDAKNSPAYGYRFDGGRRFNFDK